MLHSLPNDCGKRIFAHTPSNDLDQARGSVVEMSAVPHRDVVDLDLIDRGSMACPALPTCGLAVTESERGLPAVNARLRALLTRMGFDDSDAFVVRMTGAPCSASPSDCPLFCVHVSHALPLSSSVCCRKSTSQ